MDATLKCDDRGRIYLTEDVRETYGAEFVLVKAPDELILLPVPKDPIADMARLGKNLPKKSLKAFREEILEQAYKEAKL